MTSEALGITLLILGMASVVGLLVGTAIYQEKDLVWPFCFPALTTLTFLTFLAWCIYALSAAKEVERTETLTLQVLTRSDGRKAQVVCFANDKGKTEIVNLTGQFDTILGSDHAHGALITRTVYQKTYHGITYTGTLSLADTFAPVEQ